MGESGKGRCRRVLCRAPPAFPQNITHLVFPGVFPLGYPHFSLRALHRLFAMETGRGRGRKTLLDVPPN